jgi:hypothetical protein
MFRNLKVRLFLEHPVHNGCVVKVTVVSAMLPIAVYVQYDKSLGFEEHHPVLAASCI